MTHRGDAVVIQTGSERRRTNPARQAASRPRRFRVLIVAGADAMSAGPLSGMLHGAGCQVDVLCPPGHWAMRSRYVTHFIAAPRAFAELLELARRRLDAERYDWVILADDPTLQALEGCCDHAWARAIFPIACPRHRRAAFSKIALIAAAAEWGLATPRSLICDSDTEARAAAEILGYPFVLKDERSAAGSGVVLVPRPEAVPAAFAKRRGRRVAQAYVDGRDLAIEALYEHGRARRIAASYLERRWPQPFGPSTARRIAPLEPELQAALEEVGRRAGLHGLISFDFRVGPQGPILLEMQTRPTAVHSSAWPDFAGAVRAMIAGADGEIAPPPWSGPSVLALFPQDVLYMMHTGSLRPLLCAGQLRHAAPWRDGPLLRGMLRYVARDLLSRKFRRRVRSRVGAWRSWRRFRSAE